MDKGTQEMRPKMIIDCDPGHDDAVAIILAHVHAEVLGITTVSGNAPLESTTSNALSVLEAQVQVKRSDRFSDVHAQHYDTSPPVRWRCRALSRFVA